MKEKKGFRGSMEAFFSGKGFYIVLFLCVAVIGLSAWAMLSGNMTDVEKGNVQYAATPTRDVPVIGTKAPDIDFLPVIEPEEPTVTQGVLATEEPEAAQVWNEDDSVSEASRVYAWPVAGGIEIPFSMDALIYNATLGDWRVHEGLDIAAALGDHVRAVASGKVESVYADDLYGTTVIIDHGAGLRSIYANLAEQPTVYEGDSVSAGEIVGAVGNTALAEVSEVYHLHFAMTQDGSFVNPADFLP